MGTEFVQLSLTPLLTGLFAALACALPGNFLILRREALMGDAISHVVMPGIVVAFLITGTITTSAMLIGASAAAGFAVLSITFLTRIARIEPGAAMGVTFTTMFAAGVMLLERSDTSGVHLDVEHALYGNLESLVWFAASGWGSVLEAEALRALPPELLRMTLAYGIIAMLMALFWRPLAISTFDEGFAITAGIHVRALGLGLVMVAALAAVAAFDAVGSIIVIAMFICPPAAARLMTNNLIIQVLWSQLFAAFSALAGYILAGYGPIWLGYTNSVSAAGMIATLSGLILAAAALFGPCAKRNGQTQALA